MDISEDGGLGPVVQPVIKRAIKSKFGRDFPGGPVDKTPGAKCRGPGFNPVSGN